MKNTKIAEEVKNAIMKDLFADVNAHKCVLDLFLQNQKEFKEIKYTIHKVSITFLNKCQQQLKTEADKGNILFFRKYGYEKILNTYLAKTYKVENPEMELFSSERKLKEEEEKCKKAELQLRKQAELENQRLNEEKKRKEREKQEKDVLSQIGNLEWKKTVGVSNTFYEATFYDEKKVEFIVTSTTKNKNTTTSFCLKYDKKQFYCTGYDGKAVINSIEKTHPKMEKTIDLYLLDILIQNLLREKKMLRRKRKLGWKRDID